jgi:hypothetical protein
VHPRRNRELPVCADAEHQKISRPVGLVGRRTRGIEAPAIADTWETAGLVQKDCISRRSRLCLIGRRAFACRRRKVRLSTSRSGRRKWTPTQDSRFICCWNFACAANLPPLQLSWNCAHAGKRETIPLTDSAMHASQANSEWKNLYEVAVRETDVSKLPERIATARDAILNRIQQSIGNPALGDHCAMDAALRTLRRLARA